VIRPRNPGPAEPVPKTKQAGWPALMMITPGLTQMGTQNPTIRSAAAAPPVDLEAAAGE
jgi:hypothetical protein